MITALAASKAYAATGSTPLSLGKSSSEPKKMDFGDMLKSAMTDTVQSSRQAEHKIAQQAAGKAEMIDVVTAISSAEASLETVISIRDQVISAYQEIMRMSI
ncbi:flagellar hook-basal body complex protein FliE [Caulobacter sp. D4A]|jgi:flagellar hook-basal body complex protein FliE|uniref:flagellar hook-basal body complex protein FliE n=1 Tax=unclassified Caulobacter TaxID=2648921 RepID=UPI000D734B5E|nr:MULTISPECIES: flagellar hook-basal body complex protein FliE [unclassified Caulobacter]PXA82883.1 flagellar hook-basal body complex protein FliE [Caulobacter sp. D4A]PXA88777.1 flagellar hook-basal body complex protein FliE [Caulobacter sp. D5]